MIVSNEPGYYETDNFGIRIENLLVVVPKPDLPEFSGRPFLGNTNTYTHTHTHTITNTNTYTYTKDLSG